MHKEKKEPKYIKPLVFIVEDNEAYRILLGRILEKRGFMIMMFENGRKAVEMLEYCKPSLIISDIQMPCMDGFELYVMIKKRYPKFDIPFVYLSSTTSQEEIEKATKLSMREMLGKPVRPDELMHSINKAILSA
tara:strand:+ start:4430 stop:4831 length:402 start_codon:yes stop_codon:yes gene_type:complete